jgi:hypothetical protein
MRAVVDCLPYETKLAMLEGLERYEIIAGAYSDRQGRVCPMLAAHRCGGRTDFRAFARAWDRFTAVGKRSRRASERELRTLSAHLERSVWEEERQRELITRPAPMTPRDPEPPRPSTPSRRRLGSWLLPARSWDEYRHGVGRALRQAERPNAEGEPERQPEPVGVDSER